jgi:hypothetical protein
MNTRSNLVAIALLGLACGPPQLIGDGEPGTESGDMTTDEVPSNPSTSSTSNTTANANSSTTETDTSDSEPDETFSTFVPVSEVGGCSCDPFAQDCPEGEKCVPYASSGDSWDGNKCVSVTGDLVTGEPCTYGGLIEATDDCDATGICVDRDGDMLGTCHAFCMGTADDPECPDAELCEIAEYGTVALCVEQCNPLLQDCEPPLGCYWEDTGFHCLPGGEWPIEDPCSYVNDCPPGNMCVDASLLPICVGEACCTSLCEIGLVDNLCLIPGSACVPFFEQGTAPEGLELLGLCLAP